jgi:hypothetical protein
MVVAEALILIASGTKVALPVTENETDGGLFDPFRIGMTPKTAEIRKRVAVRAANRISNWLPLKLDLACLVSVIGAIFAYARISWGLSPSHAEKICNKICEWQDFEKLTS